MYKNYDEEVPRMYVRAGTFGVMTSWVMYFFFSTREYLSFEEHVQTELGLYAVVLAINTASFLLIKHAIAYSTKDGRFLSDQTNVATIGAGVTAMLLAIVLFGVPFSFVPLVILTTLNLVMVAVGLM